MLVVRLNIPELWDTFRLWVCSVVEESRENIAHRVNISRHLKANLLGFVAFLLVFNKRNLFFSRRSVSGIKAF